MVNDEKTLVSRDGKKRTLGKIDHAERTGGNTKTDLPCHSVSHK
jgi:hypothetical protein